MTLSEKLADFVIRSSWDDLTLSQQNHLKICVLDAIGCALGALGEPLCQTIKKQTLDLEPTGKCTLIGGNNSAPDRTAFFNSVLVRYLDFNDSFLAKGETCHPSDNLGAILSASEYTNGSGRQFLESLAVAYQVQCLLSQVAPVRDRGFDHTTQGAYGLAAGISKALGLTRDQTANSIGIAGTAFNALRVTRTGRLSNWKGLAYPNLAFAVLHSSLLAMNGITGPLEVFEGAKGFMETISGHFYVDFSSLKFDLLQYVILKKFNAEIHSQSTLEGVLDLKEKLEIPPALIDKIQITIFDVAYNIIGGGNEGEKKLVQTKEQADHSLPYLIAAILLDGEVTPAQFTTERINRQDIQTLLQKIQIMPSLEFSARFPQEMPVYIQIYSPTGQILETERRDYEGFHTRPADWDFVEKKFRSLSSNRIDDATQDKIITLIKNLESEPISSLLDNLKNARIGQKAEELHEPQLPAA